MSVVAIISTKGGAGKSTVAVHLAVAAALKKRRPLLIDFDKRQLSVLLWAKGLRKKARTPAFLKGNIETLAADIAVASRRHDLIIIDVAAGGGDNVRDIASIAEHVLVPVRASAFDMSATRNTFDLLRKSADSTEPVGIAHMNALGKAAIVLNCAPKRQSAKWRAELEDALQDCGGDEAPIIGTLSDRCAYSTAIENGQGVTEEQDDPDAVAEILDLYDGVVALEAKRAEKIRTMRRRK